MILRRMTLLLVSIPQRDIGILEPRCSYPQCNSNRFNPSKGYRHFGTTQASAVIAFILFQSLKGISAFWNRSLVTLPPGCPLFQSLKGISAFWNLSSKVVSVSCASVSIPQRDISILERFLEKLARLVSLFQSLKGISAFWNT